MIESQRLHLKNTIASLIHNCKNIRELNEIHSHVIVSPYLSPNDRSFLISRLFFYLCTVSESPVSLHHAKKIFNVTPNPSLFVYNAMIRANATKIEDPRSCQSLFLYKEMLGSGLVPDCITFPFVLKECSKRVDWFTGRSIHVHALKFGYEDDVYVQNALISLYSECGILDDARRVFDGMSNRDVVSWNSMIVGCLRGLVQGGRAKEALDIFHEMQISADEEDTVCPDKVTVASALSACAALGAIDQGKWVHSYLERSGMECDMVIRTALVDMYGKCGCVERAYEVFKGMPNKDVLAWTAMISVLALHGYGDEAFELFKEMEAARVRPNAVTFVGLLSACAHSGLVEKGRWCFHMMRHVHCIEPQVQHYACMIDILGRAGLFIEAKELIRTMPMKPDVFVWGALLGACQLHGNVKLGEKVARYLIDLEPDNHAFYIILCDLYAKSGRFDDQKRVRSLMKEQDIRKSVPGSSMIEVDGVVYEFSVKGSPEMLMEALQSVLMLLSNEMKIERNIGSILSHNHLRYWSDNANAANHAPKFKNMELKPVVFLLMISLATRSYLLTLLGLPIYLVVGFVVSSLVDYVRELRSDAHRPPVAGPMMNQLIHFNRLFDYHVTLARRYHTYRLITESHCEVYTTDPLNVEYILKANFPNYGKGEKNCDLMKDLFGDGIFAVDGTKWRHQRKLASYEFSAKVLRDFSSSVFRSNAAKLDLKVNSEALAGREVDLQDMLMKSAMDTMFKVGFGVDLDTLSGSDETSNRFIKAFDDSNVIVYWRYVDVFWKVKRFLNIGLERNLKDNIKVIDNFVYMLIHHKRERMRNEQGTTKEDILSRFLIESEKDKENMTDKKGGDGSELATEVKDQISVDEFVVNLTEAALDRMQYLHATLTETLRLYPPVPLDGKCSNEDDILPDGHKIKKGDSITYMPYAMGRMAYIWGDDAEVFFPERWLENGAFQAESPLNLLPFRLGLESA
ncbi:UNVERIFIED_CONTAM: cytochrome [Sesamum angustifolium]|uniref:Cytochrome n=1 Tax=Sesamum angustifolium TaxID=2727405 RepID=A0AAW2PUJ6_9LAMI